MHSVSYVLAKKEQPRNASVGGFGDGAGHVEMKHGFRASAHFRDPSPARITTAAGTVSALAFTNEIDASEFLICWPMLLKGIHKLSAIGSLVPHRHGAQNRLLLLLCLLHRPKPTRLQKLTRPKRRFPPYL